MDMRDRLAEVLSENTKAHGEPVSKRRCRTVLDALVDTAANDPFFRVPLQSLILNGEHHILKEIATDNPPEEKPKIYVLDKEDGRFK